MAQASPRLSTQIHHEFTVGSLFLLTLLLPYTTYQAGESPFVTFFSKIGVDGAGTVMNIVVLTAGGRRPKTPKTRTGDALRNRR